MRKLCQHLLARHQGTAQLPARLRAAGARHLRLFACRHRAGAEQLAGAAQCLDRHRRRGPLRAVAPHRACLPAALFQDAAADRRARHRPADECRANTRSCVDIPPNFERDVLGGRRPAIQLDVDATAMVQAGLGSGYAQQIITTEIADFLSRAEGAPPSPVNLVGAHRLQSQCRRPPGSPASWGSSTTSRMLAIILAGAAIVREREHGTMDHLLVMPLTPFEIAMSKIWANGLVITRRGRPFALFRRARTARHSDRRLDPAVHGRRRRSICSSPPRSASSSAPSRARCRSSACSIMLVYLPMNMLSGSNTPLESMPPWLATSCRRRHRRISSPSRRRSSIAAPGSMWSGRNSWPSALIGGLFFGLRCCASARSPAQRFSAGPAG